METQCRFAEFSFGDDCDCFQRYLQPTRAKQREIHTRIFELLHCVRDSSWPTSFALACKVWPRFWKSPEDDLNWSDCKLLLFTCGLNYYCFPLDKFRGWKIKNELVHTIKGLNDASHFLSLRSQEQCQWCLTLPAKLPFCPLVLDLLSCDPPPFGTVDWLCNFSWVIEFWIDLRFRLRLKVKIDEPSWGCFCKQGNLIAPQALSCDASGVHSKAPQYFAMAAARLFFPLDSLAVKCLVLAEAHLLPRKEFQIRQRSKKILRQCPIFYQSECYCLINSVVHIQTLTVVNLYNYLGI